MAWFSPMPGADGGLKSPSIVHLQYLPWKAETSDVRQFFHGLNILNGGVRIVGGREGNVFVAFGSDHDAHVALSRTGQPLFGKPVHLHPSNAHEMQAITDAVSREKALDGASPGGRGRGMFRGRVRGFGRGGVPTRGRGMYPPVRHGHYEPRPSFPPPAHAFPSAPPFHPGARPPPPGLVPPPHISHIDKKRSGHHRPSSGEPDSKRKTLEIHKRSARASLRGKGKVKSGRRSSERKRRSSRSPSPRKSTKSSSSKRSSARAKSLERSKKRSHSRRSHSPRHHRSEKSVGGSRSASRKENGQPPSGPSHHPLASTQAAPGYPAAVAQTPSQPHQPHWVQLTPVNPYAPTSSPVASAMQPPAVFDPNQLAASYAQYPNVPYPHAGMAIQQAAWPPGVYPQQQPPLQSHVPQQMPPPGSVQPPSTSPYGGYPESRSNRKHHSSPAARPSSRDSKASSGHGYIQVTGLPPGVSRRNILELCGSIRVAQQGIHIIKDRSISDHRRNLVAYVKLEYKHDVAHLLKSSGSSCHGNRVFISDSTEQAFAQSQYGHGPPTATNGDSAPPPRHQQVSPQQHPPQGYRSVQANATMSPLSNAVPMQAPPQDYVHCVRVRNLPADAGHMDVQSLFPHLGIKGIYFPKIKSDVAYVEFHTSQDHKTALSKDGLLMLSKNGQLVGNTPIQIADIHREQLLHELEQGVAGSMAPPQQPAPSHHHHSNSHYPPPPTSRPSTGGGLPSRRPSPPPVATTDYHHHHHHHPDKVVVHPPSTGYYPPAPSRGREVARGGGGYSRGSSSSRPRSAWRGGGRGRGRF